MPRVVDEDVCPISLLMHNAKEVTIVICKWRLRLLGKALSAAKRRILARILLMPT